MSETSYKPTEEDYQLAHSSLTDEQYLESNQREREKLKEIDDVLYDFYHGIFKDGEGKGIEDVYYGESDLAGIKQLLSERGVDMNGLEIEINQGRQSNSDGPGSRQGTTVYGANISILQDGKVLDTFFHEDPNSEIQY
jgi:hypothetical protein